MLRQVIAAPRQIVRAIAFTSAVVVAAAAVALWQSGSLMVRSEEGLEVGGFGAWSSNLLAFIMPTEADEPFWPGPIHYEQPRQYEGYAYLGAGHAAAGERSRSFARLVSRRRVDWRGASARTGRSLLALLVPRQRWRSATPIYVAARVRCSRTTSTGGGRC